MNLTQKDINKIYKDHYGSCTNFVLKNSGNQLEAETNYKESFNFLLKSIILHDKEITNLGGYLFGINKNMWYSYLKKRKQHIPLEKAPIEKLIKETSIAEPDSGVEDLTFNKLIKSTSQDLTVDIIDESSEKNLELHKLVIQILKKMKDCAKILKLLYFEKKSYQDIAKKIKMKETSIGQTKKRCLENLKKQIQTR